MSDALPDDLSKWGDPTSLEYHRFLTDQQIYGNYQSGVYRNVRYEAKRSECMMCWCGYVIPDQPLTQDEETRMEAVTHMGFTARLGFDCGHCIDFSRGSWWGTYRDYPYVELILHRMIDALLDAETCIDLHFQS